MPLTGDANASQEKVDKLAGPLLEEYLHIKVIDFFGLFKIFIEIGVGPQIKLFRILRQPSKRSQRSLQQILLLGEFKSVPCAYYQKVPKCFCYGIVLQVC